MSIGADWPTKYPWQLLPRTGPHPFVPPRDRNWLKKPPRGPHIGYLDIEGNEWVTHPPPPGGDPDDSIGMCSTRMVRHTNVQVPTARSATVMITSHEGRRQ